MMNPSAWALLAVGTLQLAGAALTWGRLDDIGQPISILARATTASPAPKLLSSCTNGFEPLSTEIALEWADRNGTSHSLTLTPEHFQQVRGPGQRRSMYWTMLAEGPILVTTDPTKLMYESIRDFAFLGDGPLLRELGIDPTTIDGPIRVRYRPRKDAGVNWPRVLETRAP